MGQKANVYFESSLVSAGSSGSCSLGNSAIEAMVSPSDIRMILTP